MANNEETMAQGVRTFKRARTGRPPTATVDGVGSVVVRIERREKAGFVKGNVTKAFTIKEAKVSDVAARVEKALFGDAA